MSTPIRIAALFGAAGVALGAFGAHGLKNILSANDSLEVWRTASSYHLYHALLLLWLAGRYNSHRWAFICIGVGVFLFSGSLYTLALTSAKALGAITPLGGLLLIAGWLSMMFAGSEPRGPK